MAFGDSSGDPHLRESWARFCDQLKVAGDFAFKDHNPATPLHRADAFRFLTQNLGQAFDLALETKDTRYPALHPFCTPTRKLGGDAADFVYHQAWIAGDCTYRIWGDRGSARFFNITVQGPRPECLPNGDRPLHEPFGDVPEANLSGHQLQVASDGNFDLYIGGARTGANWLPTTPGSRKLFLRQGFDSWDERPASMRIERIDMAAPKPLPTPHVVEHAMEWAGAFLVTMMQDWPDWAFVSGGANAADVNTFPASAQTAADTKRGRAAVNMHWHIAADEALIVEFDAHDGLWMLSNMGVFFNSMDYLYRSVGFTPSRTRVDSDRKVRLVLCHSDPGYHNWLDTQGFERGNLTYRHMLDGSPVPLRTRVVKLAALAEAIPADSVRVTQEERTAQMWARFNAIRRRYRS